MSQIKNRNNHKNNNLFLIIIFNNNYKEYLSFIILVVFPIKPYFVRLKTKMCF